MKDKQKFITIISELSYLTVMITTSVLISSLASAGKEITEESVSFILTASAAQTFLSLLAVFHVVGIK